MKALLKIVDEAGYRATSLETTLTENIKTGRTVRVKITQTSNNPDQTIVGIYWGKKYIVGDTTPSYSFHHTVLVDCHILPYHGLQKRWKPLISLLLQNIKDQKSLFEKFSGPDTHVEMLRKWIDI